MNDLRFVLRCAVRSPLLAAAVVALFIICLALDLAEFIDKLDAGVLRDTTIALMAIGLAVFIVVCSRP